MTPVPGPGAGPGPVDRAPVSLRLLRATLMLVTLVMALDHTVLATAVPTIVGHLGGGERLGWIFASYTLGMCIAMPIFGRLADLYGRRRLFLLGVAGFTLASVACGFATSMSAFLVARFVQGLAGGAVALSQAIVADAVPPRDRARFSAPLILMFSVAGLAAPLIGGVITDTVGWRWIFWMNAPLGVAALAMAVKSVPSVAPEPHDETFDGVGAGLLTAWVVALVALVAGAETSFAWSSRTSLVLASITVVGFAAFVAHSRRHPHPIIPVTAVRNRTVVLCAVLSAVIGACVFGMVGYLPGVVQGAFGLSATASGLVILPMVVGIFTTSMLTGRRISATGRYRGYPLMGCLVLAAAFVGIALADLGTPPLLIGGYVLLIGLGTGMFNQITVVASQNAVPHRIVASVTSVLALVREVGIAIGAAGLGSGLAASMERRLGGHADLLSASREQLASLPPDLLGAYREGYLGSWAALMWVFAGIALVGGLSSLLLPERTLDGRQR